MLVVSILCRSSVIGVARRRETLRPICELYDVGACQCLEWSLNIIDLRSSSRDVERRCDVTPSVNKHHRLTKSTPMNYRYHLRHQYHHSL